MGVHGLWRLLDASGKPVPLETLEGKVLAIDVSIWIHQVLQGYQDRRGSVVPNAHLLGLFHRICKLLYFKIKPVFVFDGGVPMLKKNTIASRKKQKSIAAVKASQMKQDLLQNLIKHSAVKGALAMGNGEKQTPFSKEPSISPKKTDSIDDLFKLPIMPSQNESLSDDLADDYEDYDSDDSVELSPRKQSRWIGNIHNVDVTSNDFKALPADVRYNVLTDLKETRKQNSWGRLHEMPKKSQEFSTFQMDRLLKRRRVQESLESAEKEMGGKTFTLEELEQLLTDQGIETRVDDKAFRIASSSTTRLIYINDPKSLKKSSIDEETHEENLSQSAKSINEDQSIATMINAQSMLADINEYDLDNDWDSENDFITVKDVEPSPIVRNKYFAKKLFVEGIKKKIAVNDQSENDKFESKEKVDDKSKLEEHKEKSIEEMEIFPVPTEGAEQISEEDSKVGTSKSISDFDALFEAEKICDKKPESSLQISSQESEIEITNINDTKAPSSDSDTDSDLIEIQDVPIPEEKSNVLEILVKSNEVLPDEEDIFADVFTKDKMDNSDTSSRDVSILQDSTASTSFQDIEEPAMEIERANISGDQKEYNETNPVESQVPASTVEIPIVESQNLEFQNFTPEPSTSKAQELNNQVEKFKPELLKANTEKLISMEAELENEHSDLTENIGKLERQATAVTDQMRMEAQDLLRLFGIPYIVAPMEAEAQCAYLESINLTDGTVTDDSDIWLFGGRCVYKNFFNNNKRVMEYKLNDIEHHFKLSREQMIQLALLVGSDYTVGVPGIGPVTALEIIAAFPTDGDDLLRGLGNFCSWIKNGRSAGPGRTALRNKLRNVQIERGFPSQAVVQAYLFPTVDESKEAFTWSKPNLTLLSDYSRQKFGWTRLKFEEIIGPVVKKLAEAKSQKSIGSYFSVKTVPKSIEVTMSKRVQKAVQRLGNAGEEIDDVEEETSGKTTKSRRKRVKSSQESEEIVESSKTSMENAQIDVSINEENSAVASQTTKENVARITLLNSGKKVDEFIPQREKDRANAAKKKLRAIEVFRKSRKATGRKKSTKRPGSKVMKEAALSESSDSA